MNELETKVLTVPEKARALTINSMDTYQQAGALLVAVKVLRKEINASFDPIIEAAFKSHKTAVAEKKRIEEPLVVAEGILKPAMAQWNARQEELRRAEELRLQELARKQEEERQLQSAIAAENAGDKRAAEAILAAPVFVPPVVLAPQTPKLQGVSFQERWTFRIIDPALLPRDFLKPDEIKIGQYARAMKSAGKIPGVEIYSEKIVAGRA